MKVFVLTENDDYEGVSSFNIFSSLELLQVSHDEVMEAYETQGGGWTCTLVATELELDTNEKNDLFETRVKP